MSTTPIVRSADLQKLRDTGYNIQVTDAGCLTLHDVPYVNNARKVLYDGILVSKLELAGDITARPEDHTVKFVGEYPCDSVGNILTILQHESGSYPVGSGIIAQHSFSRKPLNGYTDYFEKMTAYVALLGKHAAALDPDATARTGRVIEPENDTSPFNYLDTASSRAEINEITARLGDEAVAIVGVGGTGSYVLDLIAKTPIKAIHLFDRDRFLTHNAFRAPGAPAIEDLRKQPLKVDHFKEIYSRMHRGIHVHPVRLDATNAGELAGMSFVFLCMDGGPAKRAIVEKLEELGISFVDVGIGLTVKSNKVRGTLRSVLSLPDKRDQARARISFALDDADNEYDKNIQVADLNALNACLAVVAWKKLRGFYFDQGKERFNSYAVASSRLANADIPV
jgi:hypothetical protein